MANQKSDVQAKAAFVKELENRGFIAQVVKAPADIKAVKDGQTWYFEIKMTKRKNNYFGGATMTEWKQAFVDSEYYRFVVAKDLGEGNWDFREYTPGEFMEFCTIPPFKVYFNIDFTGKRSRKTNKKSKAVRLSPENFRKLADAYEALDKGREKMYHLYYKEIDCNADADFYEELPDSFVKDLKAAFEDFVSGNNLGSVKDIEPEWRTEIIKLIEPETYGVGYDPHCGMWQLMNVDLDDYKFIL